MTSGKNTLTLVKKEKNACPGKGLAWNREFIRMTCEILRYAP